MSERFEKIFALPENIYADGSPLIIAAGALLRDTNNGKLLAQIKLQNIGSKAIKAVTVIIIPMDSAGRQLGQEVEYQYLDLSVNNKDIFAQKTPIYLPDSVTRTFSVIVKEIIYEDNSVWREIRLQKWTGISEDKYNKLCNDPKYWDDLIVRKKATRTLSIISALGFIITSLLDIIIMTLDYFVNILSVILSFVFGVLLIRNKKNIVMVYISGFFAIHWGYVLVSWDNYDISKLILCQI